MVNFLWVSCQTTPGARGVRWTSNKDTPNSQTAEQKRAPADRFRLRIRSDSKRPGLCRSLPVAPPAAWPHVPTSRRSDADSAHQEAEGFGPAFSVTRGPCWVHIDPEANVSFPVGASRWLDPLVGIWTHGCPKISLPQTGWCESRW